MIRTQVYIPDDLHREALLVAKTRNTNFSTLVREGLSRVVKKNKRRVDTKFPLASLIGALKYGPKDLSSHVDDIYK